MAEGVILKNNTHFRLSKRAIGSTAQTEDHTRRPATRSGRVKLLVSILNRDDGARLNEILDELSISLSLTFAGTGTARSNVLDYLGIGETEKEVLFTLIPEGDEELILREIRSKMSLFLVGRGISFTVPLSGISEIVANGIGAGASSKTIDGSKIMTEADRKYDLIVAAVAADYVDDAINAAREAGAPGGTVIRARALNNEKAEHFIGMTLTEERDMLLVLTKREFKKQIMDALSEKVGLKSEAAGLIFSLPVDRTAGISADEEGQNG